MIKRSMFVALTTVLVVLVIGSVTSMRGAEDRNITVNFDNQSKYTFNVFNPTLPWGKWQTQPQPLTAGTKGTAFYAMGADGSATGTSGSVEYRDGAGHSFVFQFDIPYSSANSGGLINCVGCDKDFVVTPNPVVPTRGNSVTVNFTIKNK